MKHPNTSILIASYAKAYDLWDITHHFFEKYWSDCSFDIFLGANGEDKKAFCPSNWKYINEGEDISWSTSMLDYLGKIESKYILLFLDDFMLLNNVMNNNINQAIELLEKNQGVMVRMTPNPKGDINFDSDFTQIDVQNKVPYATSLQVALWDKEFLVSLLQYGFNPWEFETKAGKTQEAFIYFDKLFVAKNRLIEYTHYVEKGKFYPSLLSQLKDEKKEFDLSKRSFLTNEELEKIQSNLFRSILNKLIPTKYKNKLRKLVGYHEL